MRNGAVAAIDLGATTGRVVLGTIEDRTLRAEVVARFPNTPTQTPSGLHWNVLGLFQSALDGLAELIRDNGPVVSVGVDSWAVDYGLLRAGRLLGNPYHYRDERNAEGVAAVHSLVPPRELYQRNGLQFLPFNTVYQLTADRIVGALDAADRFLLIPDLFNFWLTGEQWGEATNASTTGLFSPRHDDWDRQLAERLGLAADLFPPVVQPGQRVGSTLPQVTAALGLNEPVDVLAVASHDTASAVAAIPMDGATSAYISCGTWGLVGVELDAPILTEAARSANFTNEGGVDGRIRFLHNVTGLWLLSESVRTWELEGHSIDLQALLDEAAALTTPVAVFDTNDQRFLPPGDMPARIADYCRVHGLAIPGSRAQFARSIIESLAEAFAVAVGTAAELSGKQLKTVHLVGGGALNALLCQLTADRIGLEVCAGPVEATAIGNVLIQARAAGLLEGDLEQLRAVVASSVTVKRYVPRRR